MRATILTRFFISVGTIFVVAFLFVGSAYAATFTVDSPLDTSDASAGDGVCDDGTGVCTLRAAIEESNALSGTDVIDFVNLSPAQLTIAPATNLPAISDTVTITGASAFDVANSRPSVLITGSSSDGLRVLAAGAGSQISGLEIDGFTEGIDLSSGSSGVVVGTNCDGSLDATERNVIHGTTSYGIRINNSSGNTIAGNYLGVEADGLTVDMPGFESILLDGAGSDGNIIGFTEGSIGSCSAVAQRNIIGASAGADGIGIRGPAEGLFGGDASVAPDSNIVSGNYIGVGPDGVTDIAEANVGVDIRADATFNIIGTDGDGVDDALEGNVISGWATRGIFVFRTGNNRFSGNLVGLGADGTTDVGNGERGILLRGTNNIVGWCDVSVDATLCSNGGSQATQANIVGFNGEDGIRFGSDCDDCKAFGNYIGTDATGTSDFGNTENGIRANRGDSNAEIGGSTANHRNTIKFNNIGGVLIDGQERGGTSAVEDTDSTEGYNIENNVISENDDYGIRVNGTELYGTAPGPSDGTVVDNIITDNGASGVVIAGSSPEVTGNTITDNGGYGIESSSSFRVDEPASGASQGVAYDNSCDTMCPAEASNDLISAPIITGNSIDGNPSGGIFILDDPPTNIATLDVDNTIGTNGDFDIRSDWYAAVELLDASGDSVISGSTIVKLIPAGGISCTGICTGSNFSSAGGGEGVWGPAGIDYNDATTWFQVTEFNYDTAGVRTDYTPYRIEIAGEFVNSGGVPQTTFDGDDSDETDTGHLPTSITTQGVDRYQIAEAIVAESATGIFLGAPSAPEALMPVSLDDQTIRWFFTDTATNETGFRVFEKLNGEEHQLVDTGSEIVTDISFLDETELAQQTEYCNRFVQAFNGAGYSSATALPCVTTLAQGEEPVFEGLSDIKIEQNLFLIENDNSNILAAAGSMGRQTGIPLALFFAVIFVGHTHSRRKRRLNCSGAECKTTMNRYFVGALIGAIALVVAIQLIWNSIPVKAAAMTPITNNTTLAADDVVRFEITVTNEGSTTANNLIFSDKIEPELYVQTDSIYLTRGSELLRVFFLQQSGSLLAFPIGDLAPGISIEVQFDAIINTSKATIENVVDVTGDNIAEANSTVLIRVDLPPLEAEAIAEAQPFRVIKQEGEDQLYMIDIDGTRRPFIDSAAYISWYDDFLAAQILSKEDIAFFRVGAPMLPRPGTFIVKEEGSETMYTVEPMNVLREISSEQARGIYGEYWQDGLKEIPSSQFSRYLEGEPLVGSEIPSGIIISTNSKLCYVSYGRCRIVSENGKTANRFFDQFIITVTDDVLGSLRTIEPIIAQEAHLLTDRLP